MSRSTSFYYSFLVLPRQKRLALTAVFDFCRAVDDAVDLEFDRWRAAAAVDAWRRDVARLFAGSPPQFPESRALKPFLDDFHLPREHFDALIDGVAMDIEPQVYPTFSDLERYCHRVASAVGLICAEIFGYRSPGALLYARDLGVALQLTNILRDVAVDANRGRVYIPADDLGRFGCGPEDVHAEANAGILRNDRLRSVLGEQAVRARAFFAKAADALPPEDARAFLPAEIMRAIYWDLLLRVERARFDVFSSAVRVPRPAQAAIAMATWWGARRTRAT